MRFSLNTLRRFRIYYSAMAAGAESVADRVTFEYAKQREQWARERIAKTFDRASVLA